MSQYVNFVPSNERDCVDQYYELSYTLNGFYSLFRIEDAGEQGYEVFVHLAPPHSELSLGFIPWQEDPNYWFYASQELLFEALREEANQKSVVEIDYEKLYLITESVRRIQEVIA